MSIFIHNNGCSPAELGGTIDNQDVLDKIIYNEDFVNYVTSIQTTTITCSDAAKLITVAPSIDRPRKTLQQLRTCRLSDTSVLLCWVDNEYIVRYRILTVDMEGNYRLGYIVSLNSTAWGSGVDIQLLRDKTENGTETIVAFLLDDNNDDYRDVLVALYKYDDNTKTLTYYKKQVVFDPGVTVFGMSLNRVREDVLLVNICTVENIYFQFVTYDGASTKAGSLYEYCILDNTDTDDFEIRAAVGRYGDGQVCLIMSGVYEPNDSDVAETYAVWFKVSNSNTISLQSYEFLEGGVMSRSIEPVVRYAGHGRFIVSYYLEDNERAYIYRLLYDGAELNQNEASFTSSDRSRTVCQYNSDYEMISIQSLSAPAIVAELFQPINKQGSATVNSDSEIRIDFTYGASEYIPVSWMHSCMIRDNVVAWLGCVEDPEADVEPYADVYAVFLAVDGSMPGKTYTTKQYINGVIKANNGMLEGVAQEDGAQGQSIKILKK